MFPFIVHAADKASTVSDVAERTSILEMVDQVIPGGGFENLLLTAMALGAVLAFGVLVFAGVKYSLAGGNESKKGDAIAWIKSAAGGMALLAFGFVLMSVISPRLLRPEVDVKKALSNALKVIEAKEMKDGYYNGLPIKEYGKTTSSDFKGIGDWYPMIATAYTKTGNPTCADITPRWGIAAVDPNYIPLGTQFKVEVVGNYGDNFPKELITKINQTTFTAADTGGAIKAVEGDLKKSYAEGHADIDLFFEPDAGLSGEELAEIFGRVQIKIQVVEGGCGDWVTNKNTAPNGTPPTWCMNNGTPGHQKISVCQ